MNKWMNFHYNSWSWRKKITKKTRKTSMRCCYHYANGKACSQNTLQNTKQGFERRNINPWSLIFIFIPQNMNCNFWDEEGNKISRGREGREVLKLTFGANWEKLPTNPLMIRERDLLESLFPIWPFKNSSSSCTRCDATGRTQITMSEYLLFCRSIYQATSSLFFTLNS